MKRILMHVGMVSVIAVAMIALCGRVSAQGGNGKHGGGKHTTSGSNKTTHNRDRDVDHDIDLGSSDNGQSHKKDAHGYKNYGQYRSTQVGKGHKRH